MKHQIKTISHQITKSVHAHGELLQPESLTSIVSSNLLVIFKENFNPLQLFGKAAVFLLELSLFWNKSVSILFFFFYLITQYI
jgi:hypothetical protein